MSILSARTKANMSQAALGEAVGVSDANVCQWEKGKYKPRADVLLKIADVLNCTVDELLSNDLASQEVPG